MQWSEDRLREITREEIDIAAELHATKLKREIEATRQKMTERAGATRQKMTERAGAKRVVGRKPA